MKKFVCLVFVLVLSVFASAWAGDFFNKNKAAAVEQSGAAENSAPPQKILPVPSASSDCTKDWYANVSVDNWTLNANASDPRIATSFACTSSDKTSLTCLFKISGSKKLGDPDTNSPESFMFTAGSTTPLNTAEVENFNMTSVKEGGAIFYDAQEEMKTGNTTVPMVPVYESKEYDCRVISNPVQVGERSQTVSYRECKLKGPTSCQFNIIQSTPVPGQAVDLGYVKNNVYSVSGSYQCDTLNTIKTESKEVLPDVSRSGDTVLTKSLTGNFKNACMTISITDPEKFLNQKTGEQKTGPKN